MAVCQAAQNDEQLLSIIQMVAPTLPSLRHDLAAQLRALLGGVDARTVSRFGLGPGQVARLLSLGSRDLREIVDNPIMGWIASARARGHGSLRGRPRIQAGANTYDRFFAATNDLNMLGDYAVAAAAKAFMPASTDAGDLRQQLDVLRQLADEMPAADLTGADLHREILSLQVATVERAAALAFPAGRPGMLGQQCALRTPVDGQSRRRPMNTPERWRRRCESCCGCNNATLIDAGA